MKRQLLINYSLPKPGKPRACLLPPSPALTSTQLEIFDAWLAEDPPLEKVRKRDGNEGPDPDSWFLRSLCRLGSPCCLPWPPR